MIINILTYITGLAYFKKKKGGFASHLNEANVDIKIIQEAMGHETQADTRIYLADLEDSIITNAINAALIRPGAKKK